MFLFDREGVLFSPYFPNGRTQREFIRELALYNGYAIDFSKAAPDEMFNASVDSFLCRYEKTEVLLDKCLRKLK